MIVHVNLRKLLAIVLLKEIAVLLKNVATLNAKMKPMNALDVVLLISVQKVKNVV